MRIVLQRVRHAQVVVDGEVVGSIGHGFLALVGIERGDPQHAVEKAARKIAGLRVFADAEGKMNLDLTQVGGAVLVVSQFTLAANLDRGRRPSFEPAAPPGEAEPRVEELVARLSESGIPVATGRFGADMQVELVNDGPVTFILEF